MSQRQYVSRDRRPAPSTAGGIPRATYRHDVAKEGNRADGEGSDRDSRKNGVSYYEKKDERAIPRHAFKPSADAKGRAKTLVHTQEYVAESYRRDGGSKGIIDMTLSKLVRQISKEDEKEGKLSAVAAIRSFVLDSKNLKVISKANESLWIGLSDYFTDRSQRIIRNEVASCLGVSGIVACRSSRTDAGRFLDWIFAKLNAVETDDLKTLYIISLQEVLTCDDLQPALSEYTEIILGSTLSVLENAENPELLRRSVSLTLCLAEKYPDAFLSYFEDVVDILVGWHIESTPGSTVMRSVSEALVSLRHHWSSKMRLCTTLLRQFLEDAEDLHLGSSPEPRGKIWHRIIALFRVFNTVVEAAGDFFSASKSPYVITHEYICEIIERLLKCACVLGTHSPVRNMELMTITNACLSTIVAAADCDINKHRTHLLNFLREQVLEVFGLPHEYQVSLLVCLTKAVRTSRSQLSAAYVQALLSSTSLRRLRASSSAQVLQAVLNLYKTLLDIRDVKVLQEVYRLTMADIEVALRRLNGCQDIRLVDTNPLSETVMTEYEAELYAVFDAASLHDIAESTSNLISMYALSPGIFDMLWKTLLFPHHKALCDHPTVHFAFLHLLYIHCESHGQFFGTSVLLTRAGLSSTRPGENPPQTREHFSNILRLLTKILWTGHVPTDSMQLMLKWIAELTKIICLSPGMRHLLGAPELIELFISLGDYDLSVMEEDAICHVLHDIFLPLVSTQALPLILYQRIYEVCTLNLSNGNSATVRDSALQLLTAVPCELPLRRFWSLCDSAAQCGKGLQRCWAARRHTMSKTSGDFHAEHFRFIAAYILKGVLPANERFSHQYVSTVLERMLYSSQRRGNCCTAYPADMAIDRHESQLWFWALWEAASYCLQSKLRTPIGKPQETFLTFENCLKALAVQARQKGDDPNPAFFTNLRDASGLAAASTQHQVVLLLQFMENLEKLLYSAYEGTAVAIPSQSKAVRAFFRTNRGTCTEWLARIRMPLMAVAASCGQHAAVVRIGYELLRDAKKNSVQASQSADLERTLSYTIHALTRMNCPDAIHGLTVWVKEVFGKRLSWARPAVEKAWHRYEDAADEFKVTLHNLVEQATVSQAPKLERVHRSAETDELEQASEELRRLLVISRPTSVAVPGPENDLGASSAPIAAVGVGYCADEATDCYARLQNWADALEWLSTLHELRKRQLQADTNSGSILSGELYGHIDSNFASALMKFDDGKLADIEASLALVPGASLSQNKPVQFLGSLPLWNTRNILQSIQVKMLSTGLLALVPQNHTNEAAIRGCFAATESLVEETLRTECFSCPAVPSDDSVLALHELAMLKSSLLERKPGFLSCYANGAKMNCIDVGVGWLQSIIRVIDIEVQALSPLGDGDSNSPSHRLASHSMLLRVAAARLARKQFNFKTAEKLLSSSNSALSPTTGLPIRRELAKLLQATGRTSEAVDVAVGICGDLLERRSKGAVTVIQPINDALAARTLLSLVQWVQADSKCLAASVCAFGPDAVSDSSPLKTARKKLSSLLSDCSVTMEDSELLTEADVFVGRLYELSCRCCPTLSKAWFMFAGWCYKWGRKVIDASVQGSVRLTTDEQAQVVSLLGKDMTPQQCENILQVIGEVHAGAVITPTNEEDIADAANEGATYEDGTAAVRRKLLSLLPGFSGGQPPVDLEKLTAIWRCVVNRVYRLYGTSARAYFTYLKLGNSASGCTDSYGTEEKTEGDRDVTATLRLLRLLVKHAWELRDHLEQGFAGTPTTPWKGIVPQLFSRLGHPEPYVRQSVLGLLSRVAHDTPQLIVYPAIVGSMRGRNESRGKAYSSEGENLVTKYLSSPNPVDGDLTSSTMPGSHEEDDEEDAEAESDLDQTENGAALSDSFQALVGVLSKNDPVMIMQVKTFVDELCRITVLWDELWLGTLSQHHAAVTEKLRQLETEVERVQCNASLDATEKELLINEKHRVLLKPTVCLFERLRDVTARPAETLHEKWFQNAYGKLIDGALDRLRNPTNPECPQTSWALFRQLHHSLQQRAQKRSSLMLKMNEISGHLASLKSTTIAMPSLSLTRTGSCGGSAVSAVMIDAVCNTVQILPTKTKPKKLIFIGTDGKKYPYLFKGLEDLHLDERIMQFLSIVNNMLAATSSSSDGQRPLHRARHYSVTPLGTRSGLIQWVDGSTPLFLLYKRWQQREAIADMSSSSNLSALGHSLTGVARGVAGQGYGAASVVVPRPSEVFYSKLVPLLRPLLEERGASRADVEKLRRDWPVSAVCAAVESLQAETPDDLVAREIWSSATGSADWWQLTQAYCRSVAVMSVVGFVIGLGDRHLDNLLLDLSTGEVIHIDYNVCFDKGKSLRVPERVPFRMTQNIKAALGVTGVEGAFRSSCEHVLRTMRKGRETLLTLLEAFVYDPLVDWTLGNETGLAGAMYGGAMTSAIELRAQEKRVEREITSAMFSIRIMEIKAQWLNNRNELIMALNRLLEEVTTAGQLVEEARSIQHRDVVAVQLKSALIDAKINPDNYIYSLPRRFGEYTKIKLEQVQIEDVIRSKLSDCETWQRTHVLMGEFISSPGLAKMAADVGTPLVMPPMPCSHASDFLQTAGQVALVRECEQLENELASALRQRRSLMVACTDALHTYAAIVAQFPCTYIEDNRSCQYQKWLARILANFTITECLAVEKEHQEKYGVSQIAVRGSHASAIDSRLQVILADSTARHSKVAERPTNANSVCSLEQSNAQQRALTELQAHAGTGNERAVMACLLAALAAQGRRWLQTERTAAQNEEKLMDLVSSRDGDWFIDDLSSSVHCMHDMAEVLRLMSRGRMPPGLVASQALSLIDKAHHVLDTVDRVYSSLQEMHFNFRSIILPESMKHLLRQETCVIEAIERLNADVIKSINLKDLCAQLELMLRNTIITRAKAVHREASDAVRELRKAYDSLIADYSRTATIGQKLLVGFNGIFVKLDSDFADLMSAFVELEVPVIWKKVDLVAEGRNRQLGSFGSLTDDIVLDLLFVRRLHVMQEFFSFCTRHVYTMQNVGDASVLQTFDEDTIARPMRKFIADFVSRQLIGLPEQALGCLVCSYLQQRLGLNVTAEIELKDIGASSKVAVEDLCKKAADLCLRSGGASGPISQGTVGRAANLMSAYDSAWRQADAAKRLEKSALLGRNALRQAQMQLVRFQWLHEDILVHSGKQLAHFASPSRAQVLTELRKGMQMLQQMENVHVDMLDKLGQLENSICQRLRWAAGANPSLAALLVTFEEAQGRRSSSVQAEARQAAELIKLCTALLHFEALRTRTADAATQDNSFLLLLQRCRQSCETLSSADSSISEVEELLMRLLPVQSTQVINSAWLDRAMEETKLQIAIIDKAAKAQKKSAEDCKEKIKAQVFPALHTAVLTNHHKLISEVRVILKSLAKHEELDSASTRGDANDTIRNYLGKYKTFSEDLTALLRTTMSAIEDDSTLFSAENSAEVCTKIQFMIKQVLTQVDFVYDKLVAFAKPLARGETNVDDADLAKPSELDSSATAVKRGVVLTNGMHRNDSGLSASALQSVIATPIQKVNNAKKGSEKVTRDPATGKAIQERNSYAVSVWRRVKMKLEGREPDGARRLSVPEQIDCVIKEATELKNLALMYEGWTSWV